MTDRLTTIQENLRDFVASTVLLLLGLIVAVVAIWAIHTYD